MVSAKQGTVGIAILLGPTERPFYEVWYKFFFFFFFFFGGGGEGKSSCEMTLMYSNPYIIELCMV